MNVLRLVLFILLTPLFILSVWWVVWAFVDEFRRVDEDIEDLSPVCWCDCGRVSLGVFTHAHTKDHVTHTAELCQPCREIL